MFESLQTKLGGIFKTLRGNSKITENNIVDGIKEIRLALLEADVNYQVVKDLEQKLIHRVLGEKVYQNVEPVEQFYKIVYDELVALLGNETQEKLNLPKGELGVVLLVGLQGSGKTTTAAKLAFKLKKETSVLLIAADVYRPSAKDQLRVLSEQVGVAFYTEDHNNARKIVENGLKYAKKNLIQVAIVDTAGRLHLDEELMKEIKDIKKISKPQEIFFVADSMMGQNAISVAAAFNQSVDITGVVLTKFDSDAKAGAALSIKQITGKPIRYIGVGEKLSDLDVFYPDRIVGRILGRGDILTLVEKTQQIIEEKDAEEMSKRMMAGQLDLNDFLKQIQMMRKMGGLGSIIKMLPMMPANLKSADPERMNKEFGKMESMIFSMTRKERKNYKIIESSRKRRIAKGSGHTMRDITLFMEQFQKMGKMVKKFSKNAKLFGNPGSEELNLDPNSLAKNFPDDIANFKNWMK
ncbi:signal recognition particle protein-like [Periplaneta americana]|uniref:signal recognition particle protein-like n=1 Tax=Periplaneta americana TaxID=6978 RepID=UPI0037E76FBB